MVTEGVLRLFPGKETSGAALPGASLPASGWVILSSGA